MPTVLLPLLFKLHNKPFQTILLCHRFWRSGLWIGHSEAGLFLMWAGPTQRLGDDLEKSPFTCLVLGAGCQLELGWAVGQTPPWASPCEVSAWATLGLLMARGWMLGTGIPRECGSCVAFSNLALEVMQCHFCHILFMETVTNQFNLNGKRMSCCFFMGRGTVTL